MDTVDYFNGFLTNTIVNELIFVVFLVLPDGHHIVLINIYYNANFFVINDTFSSGSFIFIFTVCLEWNVVLHIRSHTHTYIYECARSRQWWQPTRFIVLIRSITNRLANFDVIQISAGWWEYFILIDLTMKRRVWPLFRHQGLW